MKETAIIVPDAAFPKKDPEHPCACQFRPFSLRSMYGKITWLKKPGDEVKQGEILYEAEVALRILEFPSPVSGTLDKTVISDGENFRAGDVIGYLSVEQRNV